MSVYNEIPVATEPAEQAPKFTDVKRAAWNGLTEDEARACIELENAVGHDHNAWLRVLTVLIGRFGSYARMNG